LLQKGGLFVQQLSDSEHIAFPRGAVDLVKTPCLEDEE
jgi:hypothetical protein